MEDESQAQNAIKNLDGYELHGLRLRVQESTSRVRQHAGMSNPDMCYRSVNSVFLKIKLIMFLFLFIKINLQL